MRAVWGVGVWTCVDMGVGVGGVLLVVGFTASCLPLLYAHRLWGNHL